MTPAQVLRVLRSAARVEGASIRLCRLKADRHALSYFGHPGPEVWVEWIESTVPGRGFESLRRLCQAADEHDVVLRLYAEDNGSGKLFALYERLGFERDTAGGENMERVPAPSRDRAIRQRSDVVVRADTGGRAEALPAQEVPMRTALERWFDGSTVVDQEGRPLVLYHGTTGDVSRFDLSYAGSDGVLYSLPAIFATTDRELASDYASSKLNRNIADAMRELQRYKNLNPGEYGPGYEERYVALTESFKASQGGPERGNGANVLPVYMALKNPVVIDAEGKRYMEVLPQAIAQAGAGGHDGLIVRNLIDHASPATNRPADVFVAFRPSQVKSAIGNRGTFDPLNEDIRYSFAGPRSATAHLSLLDEAQAKLAAGIEPEQVRQETGWSIGLDGMPRYEISDHFAFLKGTGTFGDLVMKRRAALGTDGPTYLPDILYHPELFEAYPSLREMEVQFIPAGVRADARVGDDVFIEVRETLESRDALSKLLHEVQHLIQTIEGFAPGGSSDDAFADPRMRPGASMDGLRAAHAIFQDLLVDVIRPMSLEQFARKAWGVDQPTDEIRSSYAQYVKDVDVRGKAPGVSVDVQRRAAYQWYRRLAGEVEARNTQARAHLNTEQRRATAPQDTTDTPPDRAIVLSGSRGRQEDAGVSAVTVRVYHGTSQAFDAFAPNERGLFFAEERARAANFVGVRKGSSPRVIEAELDIRRPWTYVYYSLDTPMRDMLDQSCAALKLLGYDGMYMPRERVWVAFEPEQVRIIDRDSRAPVPLTRAYHGSPHVGIERFSVDRIGSGEGSQSYGWGLYFTDSREVAEHYRAMLSHRDSMGYSSAHLNARNLVAQFKGDAEWATEVVREQLDLVPPDDPAHARLERTLEVLVSGDHARPLEERGATYEVDIPPDTQMLWWDRPLSEHPQGMKDALRLPNDPGWRLEDNPGWAKLTGELFYRAIQDRTGLLRGSDKAASEALAAVGIKGIKFLDGDSRSAGEGTYNYVVFSGDDVAVRKSMREHQAGELVEVAADSPGDALRAWFGSSQAVDAQGLPQMYFHGTVNGDVSFMPDTWAFFSSNPKVADTYTRARPVTVERVHRGRAVYPVYLKIERPLVVNVQEADTWNQITADIGGGPGSYSTEDLAQHARRGGYDGLILKNILDPGSGKMPRTLEADRALRGDTVVVFQPDQIRSAIGHPLGVPSNSDTRRGEKGVDAFKAWFSGSKVVDAKGGPLVVYHGTTNDFSVFDRSRSNPESDFGVGFYFVGLWCGLLLLQHAL